MVQHQYLSIREISQTTSLSGIFSLRDLFPRAVGRILNNGRRFRLGDSTLLRPQVRFPFQADTNSRTGLLFDRELQRPRLRYAFTERDLPHRK